VLHQFYQLFAEKAKFLTVYIAEAHAKDEWPVGEKVSACDQPKTLEERQTIAKRFVRQHGFKLPMVLDSMDNDFMTTFAAWPIRFYVIQNGRLAYKAQPIASQFTYNIDELEDWLTTHTA